jgi:hypothetical protein
VSAPRDPYVILHEAADLCPPDRLGAARLRGLAGRISDGLIDVGSARAHLLQCESIASLYTEEERIAFALAREALALPSVRGGK